jgi:CRP/FNR family transcriptional regulator, cyclic AMP receptor protein
MGDDGQENPAIGALRCFGAGTAPPPLAWCLQAYAWVMERGDRGLAEDRVRAAIEASNLWPLPEAVLDGLLAGARLRSLEAGSFVHREGDRMAHLDLVTSGLVRAFVSAPDGRSMTVRYVRSGGLLGAVSLFGAPFVLPATIQAVTDAELLRLVPLTVRRAAETDVRVARALIAELTDRVLSFIPEIPSGAFATVRQRIARHLLDLASANPTSGVFVARVSQQELADAAGTVREVVVKVLRQLRERGLVRTGRDGVMILDPEGLAAEVYASSARVGDRGGWNQGS